MVHVSWNENDCLNIHNNHFGISEGELHNGPLWKRKIPDYPLYWKGNPQLRIFLPLFWMKMVHSKSPLPPETLKFAVHPQMTKFDVKNYLEKIYGVDVLSVRTALVRGKDIIDEVTRKSVGPEPDTRVAYVQMAPGTNFKFPDLFAEKKTPNTKTSDTSTKQMKESQRESQQKWDRDGVPPWFM